VQVLGGFSLLFFFIIKINYSLGYIRLDYTIKESKDFVMADQPLIAYPPIKRIIKQEIPDQEEEGNWTLQVPFYILVNKL